VDGKGAKVVVNGRDTTALSKVRSEIEHDGGQVMQVVAADIMSVKDSADEINSASEQVHKSALELSKLSEHLNGMAEFFKA
jgi:methyl-accepting chemotaxis protein